MIVAKFYGPRGGFLTSINVESLSMTRELNAVGTFDFTVNSAMLKANYINRLNRARVEIDVDGERQIGGHAHSLTLDSDLNFRFRCNSYMHELTQVRSKSNAKYQDQQVIAILLDLLTYAPQWRLGEIKTMENPMVRTTIDLRGEKRLFAQIMKLIESVPNLFLREGADRTIDLGIFNEQIHPFIPSFKTTSLEVETQYSETTRQIEAYGGEVSYSRIELRPRFDEDGKQVFDDSEQPVMEEHTVITRRTITLKDALAFQPTLATHSQFPIILDKGTHIVRNIRDFDAETGGEYTEFYSEIVPDERDNPPEADVKKAGYALWLKTVKELEERGTNFEKWSADTTYMPPNFRVGDQVYLHANATRLYYDPMSRSTVSVDIGTVNRWFRVNSVTTEFDEEGVHYSLDLATSLVFRRTDPFLQLYEAAPRDIDPEFAQNALELNQYAVLTVYMSTGLTPDCFNSDENGFFDGRSASIALTDIPDDAEGVEVYGTPFSNNPLAQVRLVTPPALPNVPAVVCASLNRGWRNDSNLQAYLLVKYI